MPPAVGLYYMDDSLDVVGVHLVGGLWAPWSACQFSAATTAGVDGLFYGGGIDQLWRQALGALRCCCSPSWSPSSSRSPSRRRSATWVTDEDEIAGIDNAEHAETAYDSRPSAAGTSLVGQAQPRPATRRPA